MIGKNVSHYRILEKLGEGGMGVVYRAEDTKLQRTVVLKFLSPTALGTEEEKARFINEARAAAALNHQNICTVHEIDEAEGQPFIAMEFIDGRSLKEIVKTGPLKLDEAVDIALQVAQGLQEAHEKGIVHRDVKSANIMVTGRGQAKIMDFGLAKSPGGTRLTREGTTLGTVAYMSPEQARGEAVDHRTDIWSFGVVLYETIAGRLPFQGDYDQAVVYSILNEHPEPLTALRTGVPMELEQVVTRCLEKNPAERYQTAGDLVADLRRLKRILTDQLSRSRREDYQPAAERRLPWWPWIAAGVIIVVLALVFLPRYFPPDQVPSEEQSVSERAMLVVLPFENLGPPEDEYFADGITEEITSRLAALRGLGVVSRTSAIHYKDTKKTIGQIGEELHVDYVLEGTVRWEKTADGRSRVRVTPQLIRVSDDTHIWTERFDEQFEEIFTIQSKIAERVTEELDITLSRSEQSTLKARPTENCIAYQAYLRGLDYMKYSHSPEENYRRAEQILEQAVELDPQFALAYVQLSKAHRSLYFFGYDHTEERLALAKAAIEKAIELESELPEVHVALGYYYYQGRLDYDRALEEFSIAAKDLPNDTDLLADIAYIWRRQGHFQQAIDNLEQSVAMNPKDVLLIVELAYTYLYVRRYEEGIQYCDKAISTVPSNPWAYLVKAFCYWCWTGDLGEARATLERNPVKRSANSIWFWYLQEMFERNYQAALDRLSTLSGEAIEIQTAFLPKDLLAGLTYGRMNDPSRARSSFESALLLLEKTVQERPEDPRVHSALGLAYAGLGRKDNAIQSGEHAVELYPVTKDALIGTNRVMDLVLIYARVGEYDAALDEIDYLLSIPSPYSIPYFELSPSLDLLRESPRYLRLVREYSRSGQ